MEWLYAMAVKAAIPILTPFLVLGVKKAAEWMQTALPGVVLPPLAMAVGMALEALSGVGGCPAEIPAYACGAMLGLAGVGLRELADQTRSWAQYGAKPAK